jgi:hypothetical protein
MPRKEFATVTAGKWLARTALSMALTAALGALQTCASDSTAARPALRSVVA